MKLLPVERIIPQAISILENSNSIIVTAPPGSGKSTRIPMALLDSPWLHHNNILMLEPRRLAAVNLATWLSSASGEQVGGVIGYSIRFERKASSQTRLEIVTEGVLTRRLQIDPYLDSVGIVIFDEFHERSIHTDTALALCLSLQRTVRPDLRIVVMSATIETEALTAIMPETAVISCDGEVFPVDIRYIGALHEDPARSAAAAVSRALREEQGDMLVFLPGGGEIRRCQKILQLQHQSEDILFLPLYGDLPFARQQLAIAPCGNRRVILATDIAETSLTIDGIRIVIDSGISRKPKFNHSLGLSRLETVKISRASSVQRAGRSGRTSPGVCYRLWTENQQAALLAFDRPEIFETDLCELALNLALWGIENIADLPFPDPPLPVAIIEAKRTLSLLGAVDGNNRITAKGRRMASLPLHPRFSALLLSASEGGEGNMGADIAAILSERDFIKREIQSPVATSSDLLDRLEQLLEWRKSSGRINLDGIDVAAIKRVEQVAQQLRRIIGVSMKGYQPDMATVALFAATAFPDRIARQREPGSRNYLLASGLGAVLEKSSNLYNHEYLVALRLEGGGSGDGRIFSASSLDPQLLRKNFTAAITTEKRIYWDSVLTRIVAVSEEKFGALVIESRRIRPTADEIVTSLLLQLERGSQTFLKKSEESDDLKCRIDFVRSLYQEDGWPELTEKTVSDSIGEWVADSVFAMDRPEQFSGLSLDQFIRAKLGWQKQRELDRLAPEAIQVPSGSRVEIHYGGDGGPFIAVKLQELFGLGDTPVIAGGRYPLLIHLLSPAGRPIQMTRDLRSFWNNGYQDVKKELKGRYPKHPWPDDPWSALPTRFTKKRAGL